MVDARTSPQAGITGPVFVGETIFLLSAALWQSSLPTHKETGATSFSTTRGRLTKGEIKYAKVRLAF